MSDKTTVTIDKNYKIEITEMNHTLMKRVPAHVSADGKQIPERYKTEGYHGNVQRCLEAVLKRDVVKELDVVSIKEYITALESLGDKRLNDFKEAFKVDEKQT